MSKRFTDTDKWKDEWFLDLSAEYKLIWNYLCDTCTPAGRWKKSFKHLNFCCDSNLKEEGIKKVYDGRIIDCGTFFFIPKFLRFQYPKGLNSDKPALISIRNELLEYELISIVKEQLGNDYLIIKDKDKDKDKDTDKDKDKGVIGDFEEIWAKYPNKDGKKAAKSHFDSSIKTKQDWQDINKALTNYLKSEKVLKGYIKNGSTWFNNWKDWVDYNAPIIKKEGPGDSLTDIEIEKGLGKIATKEMIKSFLKDLPQPLWGRISGFLRRRYPGDGDRAYMEAERELLKELRQNQEQVSKLTEGIGNK